MRAFLTRLQFGGNSKDKDSAKPRKQWPPPPEPPLTAFKPLPELVHASFASQLTPRAQQSSPDLPQAVSDDPPGQISPKPTVPSTTASNTAASTCTDVHRKVAFISPPQSPVLAIFERDLPQTPQLEPAPVKTTVSRFQATHGEKSRTPPPPPPPPPAAASSSKVDVSTSRTIIKATTTRATSPYLQRDVLSAQSLRSTTPYSTMSAQTSGSRILAAASWSELTEDDLVSNIGSRERTRQEVLFEIISSEERYVYLPT